MDELADQAEPRAADHADPGQEEQLRSEVTRVVEKACREGKRSYDFARFWNLMNIGLGGGAAVLAAVAGYAGLASAAGRLPAAAFALTAAACAAGNAFLQCEARYEWNRRQKVAWRGIEVDARLTLVREAYQGCDRLSGALQALLDRQKALFAGDFDTALGAHVRHQRELSAAGQDD